MKLTKKLTVLVLAFLMIFALSGCSGLKVVKEIASVDGNVISEGEFKYYLENIKTQMLSEAGLSSEEEIESFWAGDINGEKAVDVAKNKALDEVIRAEDCKYGASVNLCVIRTLEVLIYDSVNNLGEVVGVNCSVP